MAEAFVSSVLEQLTSIISQEIQQEVRLVVGVEKQVKKLTNNLRAIQAVLADAEQKQVKEITVRHWLDQLKDASYEMEDVLDEWKTAMMKLQIEGVPKKKVCFPFPAFCFCFKQVGLRHDIALKIKEINENLDDISKLKDMFNFSVIKSSKEPQRVESVSFVDVNEIHGRAEEKDALISKLLCESSEQQEVLHIISIVGMGGIGKTTLAQLAYNDNKVINHFEKRMWVCVSDPFDEFRVAKAIIEALEGSRTSLGEFQSLLERIEASIARTKFLLVLDDVWTEDYNKWEPFQHCLKNGLYGSKILVTTRKKTVAQMMESFDIITIEEMSYHECWLLFKHFAFFGRPSSECEKLEEIGRKIVDKCKGLPLAAKTVGSLLRFKKGREEWQGILNSEMWKLEEIENDVFAPLLLSYYDLPSKIKPCFSYCAVFLKDHIIEKDKLIKLWMAQGYIEGEENNEMEIVGEEYFNYLVSRSFFQEFQKDDDGNVRACKMHDIVHDFTQFLRKNECFSIEISGPQESLININSIDKVRHSMLVLDKFASLPDFIVDARRLRSLLIFDDRETYPLVKENVFDVLTCLRALRIARNYYYPIEANVVDEISKGIKNLIHLRYLKLSYLTIKELPESCCELYNLQTLDIENCQNLRRLPQGIGKLVSLRHLITNYCRLESLPKEIGRLTGLRTLNDFPVSVSHDGQCNLECLEHLSLLRGFIRIRRLGNVTDVDEVKKINLEKKINLSRLELCFDKQWTNEETEVNHEAIIEAFQPNPNIERLYISDYKGKTVFPNWLMSLTNLKHLTLLKCINCENMPPLGKLPSLEQIGIADMSRVKRVGVEFLGIKSDNTTSSSSLVIAFPKLKRLTFLSMTEWEEWNLGTPSNGREDIRIMPNLKELKIYKCFKLKSLPDQILWNKKLETLLISHCPILKSRFQEETGKDRHKIALIPNITLVGSPDEDEDEDVDEATRA